MWGQYWALEIEGDSLANMQIVNLAQINAILSTIDLIPPIEAGFQAYSAERAVVPPVGELLLKKGEVHIKYGYLQDDVHYVVKIASGFYDNPQLGLPSSNGLMLLFSQRTGELVSILLDEGVLTDTRTAVAGAIAAKYLAPREVRRIGIVGTGTQARLQLQYLMPVTDCRDVLVWGRGQMQLSRYREVMEPLGFNILTTADTAEIQRTCNLIVTTTPADKPLLFEAELRPGTHMTAVGSDTAHKQELETAVLGNSDLVVADSIAQCLLRGEIHHAIKDGQIRQEKLLELGNIISGKDVGRMNDEQISVADLTGVAVQDIQIANAVYSSLS